jgi:hypothetical protein
MPAPGRRSGSSKVLLGILHVGSLVLLAVMLQPARNDFHARTTYRQSECTVLSGRVIHMDRSGSPPRYRWSSSSCQPELTFQLQTDGEIRHVTGYSSWPEAYDQRTADAMLESYPEGSRHTCWYDPNDPFRAVVAFGSPWNYAFLLVPVVFAVLSLVVLLAVLREERRRS